MNVTTVVQQLLHTFPRRIRRLGEGQIKNFYYGVITYDVVNYLHIPLNELVNMS